MARYVHVCTLLLMYHTDMQASNKPLIAASGAGYEAMVQLLLDKGADINIMDQVGFTMRCGHLLLIVASQ